MWVVNTHDPYVFADFVLPDASASLHVQEHQAGLNLLKWGLAYAGYSFHDYELLADPLGKPYIKAYDNTISPQFSISHSFGLVACAISEARIGCDIEKKRQISKYLYNEIEKIKLIPKCGLIDNEFANIQLWTIYEAVGKYLGIGIPVKSELIEERQFEAISWEINNSHIVSIVQE